MKQFVKFAWEMMHNGNKGEIKMPVIDQIKTQLKNNEIWNAIVKLDERIAKLEKMIYK